MNWDPAKAFNHADGAIKTLINRLGTDAGAEMRERPAYPGSVNHMIREPEPMAGIRAALTAQQAAKAAVRNYISTARSDGLPWHQIGDLLREAGAIGDSELADGGSPYYVAVAAFEYAASWSAGMFSDPKFGWDCRECGRRITDRGPYDSNPLDNQSGHGAGCSRLEAELAKYEAAWEDE